jgi:plasmid stabilization system protein ParE
MRIAYSRQSLADIDDILAHIRQFDPAAAERVYAAIQHTVRRIGQFPYSAQQVTDETVLRRVPLGPFPYLVYYEIEVDRVTVLRVVHGARRQP